MNQVRAISSVLALAAVSLAGCANQENAGLTPDAFPSDSMSYNVGNTASAPDAFPNTGTMFQMGNPGAPDALPSTSQTFSQRKAPPAGTHG